MSRKSSITAGGSVNPAEKWLEFKSDSKTFRYWDKEAKEEVEVGIPFRFILIKQMHMVRGWDSRSESRIYSNEVASLDKEDFLVKSFSGGNLVSGKWSDIKEKVDRVGGKYHKSIYALVESEGGFQLVNFALKGSAVSQWINFFQDHKSETVSNWVNISKTKQEKTGSIKYNVPVFEVGEEITDTEDKTAEEYFDKLKAYFHSYNHTESKRAADNSEEEVETGAEEIAPKPAKRKPF